MIVAGPGTGKTTVLVLRALRHLLVDRMLPEHILITTFTKKASREIRTRLIEWGLPLITEVRRRITDPDYQRFLDAVDINRFITGTLDSICEDALATARAATERPPIVIEPFAANQLLSRFGRIKEEGDSLGDALSTYLHRYSSSQYPPRSIGELTRTIRLLADRFVQDHVDLERYASTGADRDAKRAVVRIFERYREELRTSNRMDFPALEQAILQRLTHGNVPEQLAQLRAVLVDEYQDTNPLQESIYFALARSTRASFAVVGDDDQSLYRFRGATMELFRDFVARASGTLGVDRVEQLQLLENYRSRPEIVRFFNDFVQVDPAFAAARVQPPKERIEDTRESIGVPVLGMFRRTVPELAADLADFLHRVFREGGWRPDEQPGERGAFAEQIQSDPNEGNFGDAVLIGHSVAELGTEAYGKPPSEKLPLVLRRELERRGVACFNPRGQELKHVPSVQTLLGLVLEALDPSSRAAPDGRAATMFLTNDAKRSFTRWRAAAAAFLATNPRDPVRGLTPDSMLARWRSIVRTGSDAGSTAREWPVLDVIYGFIPWLPQFQDDPEHQVYLEAISRCAAEAATFSSFRATIVANDDMRAGSVDQLLYDVLAPVADELIDPDEDIMPSVPRDRLNIMTIHQAKGLEFPLVIVDVSAGYLTDNRLTRFRRFPSEPSSVAVLEEDLADCTAIGPSRRERSPLDRSFDDLVRLYYVAYSRPQSVLLLVGLQSALKYEGAPKNVAAFWRRDQTWGWRDEIRAATLRAVPGQRRPKGMKAQIPVVADRLPFTSVETQR